jgi:hypothetical protein
MLNPCLWLDKPVSVNVAVGATVTGVSVVEPKGVILMVRVQDKNGLLAANPMADMRIGTPMGGLCSSRRTSVAETPPGKR